MQMNSGKTIKYLLSLAVAALLLWFSLRGVDWTGFREVLLECRWPMVIAAMGTGIIAFALRAFRWKMLLRPIDGGTSFLSTYDAICIGNFANFVFPRIGEFVRCGYITRRHGKATYDKVLGTVVLERSWDVLVMFAGILLFLSMASERFVGFFNEKIMSSLGEKFHGKIWIVALCAAVLLVAALWCVWKFRHRSAICGKIADLIKGLSQGVSSCFRMDGKWKFFVSTLLIWTMYVLMAYFIALALPGGTARFGLEDALFLMLVGSLGWAVPAPGGIGSFHFLVSLALMSVYSFTQESGMAYAVLSHESQAVTMILCGIAAYVTEVFRKNR